MQEVSGLQRVEAGLHKVHNTVQVRPENGWRLNGWVCEHHHKGQYQSSSHDATKSLVRLIIRRQVHLASDLGQPFSLVSENFWGIRLFQKEERRNLDDNVKD